jgi:hypothetical protein
MNTTILPELAEILEEIEARPRNRHILRPRLRKAMERMRRKGLPMASAIHDLDRQLCDEAEEAMFDNLPV